MVKTFKTFKTEASNCIADMMASFLLNGQQCMPKASSIPRVSVDNMSHYRGFFKPIIHHQSDCAFFP